MSVADEFAKADADTRTSLVVDREVSLSKVTVKEADMVSKAGSKLAMPRKSSHELDLEGGQHHTAESILGNTASSNFGLKREKKSFTNLQTVDYQPSVPKLTMADGVSLGGARRGGLGLLQQSRREVSTNLKRSQLLVGSVSSENH